MNSLSHCSGAVEFICLRLAMEAVVKIKLYSIFVDDQKKALKFYTGPLGFIKKNSIPAGDYEWITVVSPEGRDDLELSLEPDENPAAKNFKEALYTQEIPFTAFASENLERECERMKREGVKFIREPDMMLNPPSAIFDDTCGNLIMIYQL